MLLMLKIMPRDTLSRFGRRSTRRHRHAPHSCPDPPSCPEPLSIPTGAQKGEKYHWGCEVWDHGTPPQEDPTQDHGFPWEDPTAALGLTRSSSRSPVRAN